jgi:hypothetical protein
MRSSGHRASVAAMTPGRHVAILCREHGIRRTVAEGRGRASVGERHIQHPPIRTEMAYFVALHEIGHIFVGLEGTRLEREAAAWDWALRAALVKPHYSTRQRICACLIRYLARAQERGWKTPAPDSRYWTLMRWWQPAAYVPAALPTHRA